MGSNQRGSDQKAMQLIVGLTIAFAISLLAGYVFIRSMMTMPGDGGGDRLEAIHQLFGQIPDVLEDVWVQVALGKIEEAKQTINAVPQKHPFEFKYHQVKKVPWESCATVLSASDRRRHLLQGW